MKKFYFTSLFSIVISLSFQPLASKNCYHEIARLYLPSMATISQEKEIDDLITSNEEDEKDEEKEQQNQNNPDDKEPTEKEQTELLFRILLQDEQQPKQRESICHTNLYNDLEIFCGNNFDYAERHLLSIIDNTQTIIGRIALAKMLYQPTTNISKLEKRQTVVKELVENKLLLEQLEEQLKIIKLAEKEFTWFWKKITEESGDYYKKVYFTNRFLKPFNKSSGALEMLHLWNTFNGDFVWRFLVDTLIHGSLTSLMEHGEVQSEAVFKDFWAEYLLPNKWMEGCERRHPRLATPEFSEQYPWFKPSLYYFFAQNKYYFFKYYVWYPIKNTLEKYKTTTKIHYKMNAVASYITATEKIGQLLAQNKKIKNNLATIPFMQDPRNYKDKNLSAEYQKLVAMLEKPTFEGEPSFFSHKGRVLASFQMMQNSKNNFTTLLKVIGKVDALCSIAQLYKKHEANNARYSFARYKTENIPSVSLAGFWSPFVSSEKAIVNDVEQGGEHHNNIIVTGPNAGGKSTHLKGITLCILLAQTIGIAPAHAIEFSPFAKINTYLNISDTAGQESLFQAEMRRAFELIKSITTLKPDQFSFGIMDEMFTGTNPLEGIAGAYGIMKKLASIPNSICLLATHFGKLTDLEQETDTVANYKVSATKMPDGGYTYPFKLEKGISHQAIALDLLKFQGFDDEILHEAYKIIEQLGH